mmetsp:Transcript_23084/g.41710  ORF Transcript_23084/g.41710 Transcript_23084/m.41710 type:complete len:284 (+) Transcript_23084:33-884(+)|eukprot:CAMPEP_0197630930 /NCGR_PEP_ID=MMETSP1338-20131121/8264_1 /TAXON_ID=43686 ORGANISM="Pelagodinium beii, Strain RCC1491" /NCGR_SAMPLE_ID=MMETSP1338 /ASSEMBLY_ACC=CAM_ASM_000754 /LENGTH=283 /DNA_ID=CAMNT_0043202275 /DNA_START=33 /DNA_END=884 /DNA_ORIENTATION=+
MASMASMLRKHFLRAARAGCNMRGLSSGSGVMQGGKHKGLTFEDCYAKDPSYCTWLLKRGDEMPPAYSEFIAFLRSRTMAQDPEPQDNSGSMFAGHASVQGVSSTAGGNPTDELGDELVGFGKYRSSSYREVVNLDSEYCRWIKQHYASEAGVEASPSFKKFASYLEGVELPPEAARQRSAAVRSQASSSYSRNASTGAGMAVSGATQSPRSGREKPGSLVNGQWPITFGNKYKDWTFAEVLNKDREYCEYVVNLVLNKEEQVHSDMLAFTVYVQHQAFAQVE